MPSYPCHECNNMLDIANTYSCNKCGNKRPFTCSKCNKHLQSADVYQASKIKTKRPIFCNECGSQNDKVKCAYCDTTIIRSHGTEANPGHPRSKVYHNNCYKKKIDTYENTKKIGVPAFGVVGAIIGLSFLGGMPLWLKILVPLLFGMIFARVGISLSEKLKP